MQDQKTLLKLREAALRERVPILANLPALRCGHVIEIAPRRFCNAVAVVNFYGDSWLMDSARCEDHRYYDAQELGGDLIVRRVRVTCEVLLGGVTLQAPAAHVAAVALLQQAIDALGGRLEVVHVSSTIGRRAGQPAPGVANGVGEVR